MRAALRLADAHLVHPGPSNLLCLHLPRLALQTAIWTSPPTGIGDLAPYCRGGSSDALASPAIRDSNR
eukprot:8631365-Alexandrium_andersonii.AAC.1